MHIKSVVFAFILLTGLYSCKREGCTDPVAENYSEKAKKDDGSCEYASNLKINMHAVFNGEALELNKDYINVSGYRLWFTDVKVIMTHVKSSGKMLADAAFFDVKKGTNVFSDFVQPGSYNGLSFFIGVDGDRNNADPTQYESDHPLNIQNISGMHWSWNTGYIFFKVEGRYDLDSTSTGTPSELFLYHLGMNEYRKLWENAQYSFAVENGKVKSIDLELDLAKLFYSETDTIDLEFENFTHTSPDQEALNIKLANNFPHAIAISE